MVKVRNGLVICMAAVMLILSLPLLFYVKLTGSESVKVFFIHLFSRSLNVAAGNKIVVSGSKFLDNEDNFLIVGNHQGMFDIVNICLTSKKALGFVSKKENSKILIMASWMRTFDSVFLDRENPRSAIKQISNASKIVSTKRSMVIFPQGTRTKGVCDFKPGSFKIAMKSKCSIVPVVLYNTGSLFETRDGFGGQTSYVTYLEPIVYDAYKDLSAVEISELVESKIRSCYEGIVDVADK